MTYYIVGNTTATLYKNNITLKSTTGRSVSHPKDRLPIKEALNLIDHLYIYSSIFYDGSTSKYYVSGEIFHATYGDMYMSVKYDGFNSFVSAGSSMYSNSKLKEVGSGEMFFNSLKNTLEFFKRIFM
jgi:hypothetical protein